MIASPGDVEKERAIAREVIHEWNDLHSAEKGIVLLPVGWETHTYPAIGDRPQAIINKQILRDCDLLIGIFWTRLGTPTGVAQSGTVEEIEEHIASGRPTMLYFSKLSARSMSIDEDQLAKVQEFKKTCRARGLIEDYKSRPDFKRKLTSQLSLAISRNGRYFTNKVWKI